MKKLLLFLMMFVAAISVYAQDVIVKKDGSTILCRIVQVNGNEIIAKFFNGSFHGDDLSQKEKLCQNYRI